MVLNLKGVLSGRENPMRFEYAEDLSELDFFGVKPYQEPVQVRGKVEKRSEYLTLCFEISASQHMICSRCGRPFCRPLSITSQYLLARTLQNESDDILLYQDDQLDLTPVVSDTVVIETDVNVLCREDCKGFCFGCGTNLNEGECKCKQ